MDINFYQYNIRELGKEKKFIDSLKKDKNNFIIGLEITHKDLKKYSDINFDPQHSNQNKHMRACVEDLYFGLNDLKEKIRNKNLWIMFLKTDLDSIAAGSVLKLYVDQGFSNFSEDVMKRIRTIANYDRYGRPWQATCMNINQLSKIKIPRGLFMLVSGWKNNLEFKIEQVTKWIITGTFDNITEYNRMAAKNFKDAVTSAKTEIIEKRKLAFVKSDMRGAMGIGFQYAPVVLALNPSFRFGTGENRVYGRKWTVAQCEEGHIDMNLFKKLVNEIENGWGGSSTIMGSPQDKPSVFRKYPILDIIKKAIRSQDEINEKLYSGELTI